MSERTEFDAAVEAFRECGAVDHGGCACLGNCLGNALAHIRRKYDAEHEGDGCWWSDQLHGFLKTRPGDSGRNGAALTAANYWTGVR